MIQLLLIAFCGLGCLVALVSSISSLIEYARRAGQGRPFLEPVFVLSHDGEQLSLPSGLVQVQHLVTSWPMSTHGEVQACGSFHQHYCAFFREAPFNRPWPLGSVWSPSAPMGPKSPNTLHGESAGDRQADEAEVNHWFGFSDQGEDCLRHWSCE